MAFLQLRHAAGRGHRLQLDFNAEPFGQSLDEIDVIADDCTAGCIDIAKGRGGILDAGNQHSFGLDSGKSVCRFGGQG